MQKQRVMKQLGKSLWARAKDFLTHQLRNEIAELEKKKNYLELLIKVMQLLNAAGIDFKAVVKAVVKDMGYLQWVLLGVSLLASVLLFIASLGVSIAFQVAALTALFLVLCIDVVDLIYSVNDSEFSLSHRLPLAQSFGLPK